MAYLKSLRRKHDVRTVEYPKKQELRIKGRNLVSVHEAWMELLRDVANPIPSRWLVQTAPLLVFNREKSGIQRSIIKTRVDVDIISQETPPSPFYVSGTMPVHTDGDSVIESPEKLVNVTV